MSAAGHYLGIENTTDDWISDNVIGPSDQEHINDGERLYFVNHKWTRIAVMAHTLRGAQMEVADLLSPTDRTVIDEIESRMNGFGGWWNRALEKAARR